MHRPPAWYDMRQLLKAQLPDLPGHLRAVLALWVEGTLLALNGCQDTVTLAPPIRTRCAACSGSCCMTVRIATRGVPAPGVPAKSWRWEGCFAPLLQWVRRW